MWAAGLGYFIWQAPYPSSQNIQNKQHTDAIVILTGGTNRLAHGISLYEKGLAEKVLISGVSGKIKAHTLLKQLKPTLTLPEARILSENVSLDYLAANTVQNAIETAAWIKDNNIRTIRLVTSIYHMPRSLAEMRNYVTSRVDIIPESVLPKNYSPRSWWKPRFLKLWVQEYHKFLLSYLRFKWKNVIKKFIG